MQKTQSRLSGLQKITFGLTAPKRRSMANGVLAAPVFSGLAFQLTHNSVVLGLLIPSVIVTLGTLLALTNRNQLEISFSQGTYYLETGSWPAVKVTGGRLSEISQITITRDLQFPELLYAAFLEFHPETKRPPYRLDGLLCSVPIGDFGDRVALYVELAARLNIPVYDDSGWNGWRPRVLEPKVIVIRPGETHPVLLQEPPKWKKW